MVTELGNKYDFDIEVVKNPQAHTIGLPSQPIFPAMEIDDELFFQDRITSLSELEAELKRRGAPTR